jgi:hypothetical protein
VRYETGMETFTHSKFILHLLSKGNPGKMKPSVGPAIESGQRVAVAVVSSSNKMLPLQLNTATKTVP